MSPTAKRRSVALSIGSAIAVVTSVPAGGVPVEMCDPAPKVASSFCVSHEAAHDDGTYVAAEPLDIVLNLENTSDGTDTQDTRWIDQLSYLLPASTGTVVVDPEIPDGLRLVGGPGSCGGNGSGLYAGCPGGHGALSVIMPFNPNDPTAESGTFGVDSIVVNSPPSPVNLVELELNLWVCIDVGLSDCAEGPMSVTAAVTKPSPGEPARLSFGTQLQGAIEWAPYPSGSVTWRAAMDTATFNLAGASDTLSDGSPAGDTYTVMGAPAECGNAGSSSTFATGEDTPRRLTFEHASLTIVDCPIAVVSAGVDGLAGVFNGTATAFNGRSIAKYSWDFGDGTTAVTTLPSVRHLYTAFGDRTVTLIAIDDAGSVSAPVTVVSKGTTIGAKVTKPLGKIKVAGVVKPNKKRKFVFVTLFKKKGGKFRALSTKKVRLNRRSKYVATFTRPAGGRCRTKSLFKGDASHRGSYAIKSFSC